MRLLLMPRPHAALWQGAAQFPIKWLELALRHRGRAVLEGTLVRSSGVLLSQLRLLFFRPDSLVALRDLIVNDLDL